MKKSIYNNVTYDDPSEPIWRNNTEPTEPETEIQKMEKKFNNPTQYMKGNKDTKNDLLRFPNEILEEFPEYLDGWDTIITNTGLVCFYNKNGNLDLVIYDMFDDDVTEDNNDDNDTSFLSDIDPDVSMLKDYNFFDQPLSVKKINFDSNGDFKGERSFIYNENYYSFYNCDGLDVEGCNFNGTFNFFEADSTIETVSAIKFHYKPVFFFKIYNADGNLYSEDTIKIIINSTSNEFTNEKIAKKYDSGEYFVDLSDYKSFEDIKISLELDETKKSGYLEVI